MASDGYRPAPPGWAAEAGWDEVVVVRCVDWYVYGVDSKPDSSEPDEDEQDAESSALTASRIVGGRFGTGMGARARAAVRLCRSGFTGTRRPWSARRVSRETEVPQIRRACALTVCIVCPA